VDCTRLTERRAAELAAQTSCAFAKISADTDAALKKIRFGRATVSLQNRLDVIQRNDSLWPTNDLFSFYFFVREQMTREK
jgi:hypothetical protein